MGFLRNVKAHVAHGGPSPSTSPANDAPSPDRLEKHSGLHGARKAAMKLSSRKDFLNVESGQAFHNGRYVVEKKLGAGSFSEVWLARDMKSAETEVAIKFLSNNFYNGGAELWELEIMLHIRDTAEKSQHPGRHHVATLLDHFEQPATPRPHICMVVELLGPSIEDELLLSNQTRLQYSTAKVVSRQLLQALDFVHTECRVLHTDITADNVLQNCMSKSSESSKQHGSSQSVNVCLGDFGSACWVDRHLTDSVQRPLFRAPEVTLKSLWDTSADIFDLGCFVFQIVTGAAPFPGSRGRDAASVSGEQDRLRQLTKLFGPIPDVVLDEAARRDDFFNPRGEMRHSANRRTSSLQQLETLVDGRARTSPLGEEMPPGEMPVFCDFLRKALATDPRQRQSAEALVRHPWLDEPA